MDNKGEEEKVPLGQKFCDNIWLLLVLGILIPAVSYTLWGVLEVISLPKP